MQKIPLDLLGIKDEMLICSQFGLPLLTQLSAGVDALFQPEPEMKSMVVFSIECSFLLPFLQYPQDFETQRLGFSYFSPVCSGSLCRQRVGDSTIPGDSTIIGEWDPRGLRGGRYVLYRSLHTEAIEAGALRSVLFL